MSAYDDAVLQFAVDTADAERGLAEFKAKYKEVLKSMLGHTKEYADLTDSEWERYVNEAIAHQKKLSEYQIGLVKEAFALRKAALKAIEDAEHATVEQIISERKRLSAIQRQLDAAEIAEAVKMQKVKERAEYAQVEAARAASRKRDEDEYIATEKANADKLAAHNKINAERVAAGKRYAVSELIAYKELASEEEQIARKKWYRLLDLESVNQARSVKYAEEAAARKAAIAEKETADFKAELRQREAAGIASDRELSRSRQMEAVNNTRSYTPSTYGGMSRADRQAMYEGMWGGKKSDRWYNAPIESSSAMRIGAGVAGAMGSYRTASGLYAGANAVGMMGLPSIPTGAAVGLGAAVLPVAAMAGLVGYSKDYVKALAQVSTLLTPASQGFEGLKEAMDKTSMSAMKLSSRYGIDVVDVMKSFKEALSSGIEGTDLERFGHASATLAKAMGEDMTSTTKTLTQFKDAFNMSVGDMTQLSDKLFNVVDVGRVSAGQMMTNLGRLIPIASTAGIKIDDMLGAFSALTRTSTVSQATTSMANIISNIINPSQKAKEAFERLGITYGEAAFKGREFTEVLREIKEKTGGSSEAIASLFHDMQAYRGATGLIKSLELVKHNNDAIKNSGTAAIAALRDADNGVSAVERSVNRLKNGFISAGKWATNFGYEIAKAMKLADNPQKIAEAQQRGDFEKLYARGIQPQQIGNSRDMEFAERRGITGFFAQTRVNKLRKYLEDNPEQKWLLSGTPDTDLFKSAYEQFYKSKQLEGFDTATKHTNETLSPMVSGEDIAGAKDARRAYLKQRFANRATTEDTEQLRELEANLSELQLKMDAELVQYRVELQSTLNPLLEEVEKAKEATQAFLGSKGPDGKPIDRMDATNRRIIDELNRQYEIAVFQYKEEARRSEEASTAKKKEQRASLDSAQAKIDEFLESKENTKLKSEQRAEDKAAKETKKQQDREEADARAKVIDDLRDEHRRSQHRIDLEIQQLERAKADIKDVSGRQAGWRTTGDPRDPRIKYKHWDPGQTAVSRESERDAIQAQIDALRQRKFDAGTALDTKVEGIRAEGAVGSAGGGRARVENSPYKIAGLRDRYAAQSFGSAIPGLDELLSQGMTGEDIKKIYKRSDLANKWTSDMSGDEIEMRGQYRKYLEMYEKDQKDKKDAERKKKDDKKAILEEELAIFIDAEGRKVLTNKTALDQMVSDSAAAGQQVISVWNTMTQSAMAYMSVASAAASAGTSNTTFNTSVNIPAGASTASADIARQVKRAIDRETNNGTMPSSYNTNTSQVPTVEL